MSPFVHKLRVVAKMLRNICEFVCILSQDLTSQVYVSVLNTSKMSAVYIIWLKITLILIDYEV